jgi:Rrf2 family protein
MRITTWAEYGVICTLHLAKRGDVSPVTGRDIAASEKLPSDYVEQILLRLRRAGVVKSTRGAKGGYTLARAPEAITIREIVSAAELGTFELHCDTHPLDPERCAASGDCSVRPVWQILQRRVDEALEGVRLSDLLAPESVVRGRVGLPVLQT